MYECSMESKALLKSISSSKASIFLDCAWNCVSYIDLITPPIKRPGMYAFCEVCMMWGRALMKRFAIVPESILYITLRSEMGRQLLMRDLSLSPLGIKVMIPILSSGDKDGVSLLML